MLCVIERRDGAVVRALNFNQCAPGSTVGPGVICGLSLLLVLASPRGFSLGSSASFAPSTKLTLLNSIRYGHSGWRATSICCHYSHYWCFFVSFRRIVGKGSKVSFVLNQDFHSGYANENSTAYSILAHNVKGEVRLTVVSKQQKHSRKVFLYSRETDQRQFSQNFVY